MESGQERDLCASLIHAAKPDPDREFPQAQTAHDTFWDFISLTPESMHMIMWVMSDRAIPRSLRMMEGFFDFYSKVWDRCDERLDLMAIVVDEDGAALHLATEFKALRDDPDFIAGPLVPGQSIFLESLVFYRFENGLIQAIRSFRASAPSVGPSTF